MHCIDVTQHQAAIVLCGLFPVSVSMETDSFLFSIVPMWAVGAIVVVVLALVACFTYCMLKKCCSKKKKSKKARERKKAGRRKKEGTEGEGDREQKV